MVFGVMFFMTQIETIFFNEAIQMPMDIVYSTLATGVIVGAVIGWLAVRYQKTGLATDKRRTPVSLRLAVLFTVVAVTYVVFYFFFGF